MPRPPGLITQEFILVDGDGKSPQVVCRHCNSARIAKSSGKRKVNHLRRCQAFLAKHTEEDDIIQLLREELPDEELRPRGRPKNPAPSNPLPPKTKLVAEPYWFPHEGLVRADATALLLVDMQQDFVNVGGFLDQLGHPISTARTMLLPLQKLLHAFRCAQFPIYHARHSHRHDLSTFTSLDRARIQPVAVNSRTGHPLPTFTAQDLVPGTPGPLGHFLLRQSIGTDPVQELAPLYSELMFDHPRSSVFAYTDLDLVIRNRGIKNLIIAGLSVNASIRDTVRDATDRGFDVCIVEGCVAAQALSKHAAQANKEAQQREASVSQPPLQSESTPIPSRPPSAQMQAAAPAMATPQPSAQTPAQVTPTPAPSGPSHTTPAPDNGPFTDLSEVDSAARRAIDDVMSKDTRHGLGFGTIAKFEDLYNILKTLAKVKVAFPGTPSHPCLPDQPVIPLPAPAPPPPQPPAYPQPAPPPPAYAPPPPPPPPPQPSYPQPMTHYATPYAAPPPGYHYPPPPPPPQPYTPQQPQYIQQPQSAPAASQYQPAPLNGEPYAAGSAPTAGGKRPSESDASAPSKRRKGRGIQWPIFYQGPPPKAAKPQYTNGNAIASVANRAPRGSQMHNPPPGALQEMAPADPTQHVADGQYSATNAEDEFKRQMMAHAEKAQDHGGEGDVDGDDDNDADDPDDDDMLGGGVDMLGQSEDSPDDDEDGAEGDGIGNGEAMQYA